MNENIREIAQRRIENRRGFWNLLGLFVVILIILNVIWLVGDRSNYWPLWPAIGFGIALLFRGLSAFGNRGLPVSEAQIDREVRKMRGEGHSSA